MADNTTITPGTGASVAADDVGGVLYQRVKISVGADGAAADATAAAPIPVTTRGAYVTVTLSLDTAIYAADDVLADTQEVAGALAASDGTGVIESIQLLDEDDQGIALDLVFLDANVSIGTENAAPSVTDANARSILGRVRIATTDYIDMGGCRVATLLRVGLGIKAATGTDDIYIAAITRGGTPTHTASGIRVRLYIAQS